MENTLMSTICLNRSGDIAAAVSGQFHQTSQIRRACAAMLLGSAHAWLEFPGRTALQLAMHAQVEREGEAAAVKVSALQQQTASTAEELSDLQARLEVSALAGDQTLPYSTPRTRSAGIQSSQYTTYTP